MGGGKILGHTCNPRECPLQTRAAKDACGFASHYGGGSAEEWHRAKEGDKGTFYTLPYCYLHECDCEECQEERIKLFELDTPERLIAELRDQVRRRNLQIKELRAKLKK
jgi:hypothetical protein